MASEMRPGEQRAGEQVAAVGIRAEPEVLPLHRHLGGERLPSSARADHAGRAEQVGAIEIDQQPLVDGAGAQQASFGRYRRPIATISGITRIREAMRSMAGCTCPSVRKGESLAGAAQ